MQPSSKKPKNTRYLQERINMKKPKMILFDYGQTLIAEAPFNGIRGTAAVLAMASENRFGYSVEEVQAEAEAINREIRRFDPAYAKERRIVEIPNHMFTHYLYESMGLKIDATAEEIDRAFWDAASPGQPTEGIEDFLAFLRAQGIRTGVISNISYAGTVVEERIHRLLPDNDFEFIIATSEYLFRKPSPRIFRLALLKAGLDAEDVWYVGDNYNCDIVGAREAGMFPVWYTAHVDYEQEDHDDVVRIKDWAELKALLG